MGLLPFEVDFFCGRVEYCILVFLCVKKLTFKSMVTSKPISLEALVFVPYVDVYQVMGYRYLLSLEALKPSCDGWHGSI